ncbi:MAG TPA: hypothetical protein DDX92_07330 [Flavobacteriales bacterium]|jgi:hypothetical protein|nr:hypothetical protein [Flavobacteriales bacterium]
MKNALFIGIALLPLCVANAQITLTEATHAPLAGESYTYNVKNNVHPAGIEQDGQNVVWDVSSIGVSNQQTKSYDLASMGAHAPMYPGATIMSITNIPDIAGYFDVWQNGIRFLGDHTEISGFEEQIVHSSGVYMFLPFPFSYGDAASSSYFGTYTNSFNQTANRTGQRSIFCQGFGTLVLPYGAVENVLKVTSSTLYTDIGAGIDKDFVETMYSFYDARNRVPIATFFTKYTDGSLSLLSFSYLDQASIKVGLNDVLGESFKVYPNPVTDEVYISSPIPIDRIEFLSLTGQIIRSIKSPGLNIAIDLAELTAGLYFIKVHVGKESIAKKMVVQ